MEQHQQEFNWLLEKISGVESILEIGCRYGDSLREMAAVAKPGAKIRAIDHGLPSGECPNPTRKELRQTILDLRAKGFDADVLFTESQEQEAVEWATKAGPFDFIFVDGDHAYSSVKQDWENYGPLAKRIGFHDIAGGGGPQQLWKEITDNGVSAQECVMSNMGVGIIILSKSKK